MKKALSLLAPLLLAGSMAHAIDPSEVIVTLDGAYARPLGPQHFIDGSYGYGLLGMVEKAMGPHYSLGFSFTQVTLRDGAGERWAASVLDLIGRRWFKPWHAFNPYVLLGVGGDLFKDAYKQPFGDVFHAQLALGSQYVFDSTWALDYALDAHVLAPLDTPYTWVGARMGLSYRYGTQPKVNQIAPPPLDVTAVEELSEAKVSLVVGMIHYTVKEGDSLYKITGAKEHLQDPELWPAVYDLNHNEIKDPNLIYPGQQVLIRRVVTAEEAKAARKAWLESRKKSGEDPKK